MLWPNPGGEAETKLNSTLTVDCDKGLAKFGVMSATMSPMLVCANGTDMPTWGAVKVEFTKSQPNLTVGFDAVVARGTKVTSKVSQGSDDPAFWPQSIVTEACTLRSNGSRNLKVYSMPTFVWIGFSSPTVVSAMPNASDNLFRTFASV